MWSTKLSLNSCKLFSINSLEFLTLSCSLFPNQIGDDFLTLSYSLGDNEVDYTLLYSLGICVRRNFIHTAVHSVRCLTAFCSDVNIPREVVELIATLLIPCDAIIRGTTDQKLALSVIFSLMEN